MNITGVMDWIKNHRRTCLAIAAVLIFATGYGAGAMKKPRIVEKEKIVTKTVMVDQTQEHATMQKDRVAAQKRHVHTEKTTTKAPDGTVTTKEVTDDNTDQNSDTQTKRDDVKTEIKTVTVDKIVERVKLVEPQRLNWRMGAGVGYSLPTAWGQPMIGIPGLHGFVIQLDGDRRLAGPVWFGVFVNTQATVGLHLSVEW
jgi:hypothetical protein